jgi:hypothetical protein
VFEARGSRLGALGSAQVRRGGRDEVVEPAIDAEFDLRSRWCQFRLPSVSLALTLHAWRCGIRGIGPAACFRVCGGEALVAV